MSGNDRIATKTPLRPDAPPHSHENARSGTLAYDRTCRECGAPYEARAAHAEFCSTGCRKDFNHRRAQRGAILYDLFMPHRHDRKLATQLQCFFLMCRLSAHWRHQERRDRDGRFSWANTHRVTRSLAWVRVDRLVQRKRKP